MVAVADKPIAPASGYAPEKQEARPMGCISRAFKPLRLQFVNVAARKVV